MNQKKKVAVWLAHLLHAEQAHADSEQRRHLAELYHRALDLVGPAADHTWRRATDEFHDTAGVYEEYSRQVQMRGRLGPRRAGLPVSRKWLCSIPLPWR